MSEQLTGAERIAAERARQVAEEGWTAEHDAEWQRYELCAAAVCYALFASREAMAWRPTKPCGRVPRDWPWCETWWRPQILGHTANWPGERCSERGAQTTTDRIRNLEKAGALIAAEIDRLLELQLEGEVVPEAAQETNGE